LRSNIPRSALCATLDTYNFNLKIMLSLSLEFHSFLVDVGFLTCKKCVSKSSNCYTEPHQKTPSYAGGDQ
jgi:hypothetical protein